MKLKLIAIKTKEKVFISDNVENKSYHGANLSNYYFDGELPQKTYKSDWFTVPSIPSKVEKKVPPSKINIRYELRDGFPESDLTPKVINESYIDDESPYYSIVGLYEKKWDEKEEGFEEIPFEINVIEERDSFEITKEEYPVKYNFLNILNVHPVLLPTTPCTLTKNESYNIIRQYVKENIDQRFAYVSSDYDFHFEVVKKVALHKPIEYKVDIGTKRKPKLETRYRATREVSVVKFAEDPSRYKGATYAPVFHGENADDLKQKVDTYLKELIEEINRPYVDCEHCQGTGVLLKGE